MILYICAVGFSEFTSTSQTEELVESIVKNPTSKYISNYSGDVIKVEYYKEYGDTFGLVVRGELDAQEELTVYSLIPYMIGRQITDTNEIDVIKSNNKDEYNVYCEESEVGTPFSFYLQNVIDYLELKESKDAYIDGIRLVAFSVDGKVILPIEKDDEELDEDELDELMFEDLYQRDLYEKAKNGDEEAMNILEEEAIEATQDLEERLKDEDLLSILEGFFVPVDDSDDVYSILGTIIGVESVKNNETEEELFLLQVECLSITMDLLINKDSLIGEPSVGMRFKGVGWVQGIVEFHLSK